jgi:hypothetical protein
MMSLELYLQLAEDWEDPPDADKCPFAPKSSDWGWHNRRMVALDYSTPAWETWTEAWRPPRFAHDPEGVAFEYPVIS